MRCGGKGQSYHISEHDHSRAVFFQQVLPDLLRFEPGFDGYAHEVARVERQGLEVFGVGRIFETIAEDIAKNQVEEAVSIVRDAAQR